MKKKYWSDIESTNATTKNSLFDQENKEKSLTELLDEDIINKPSSRRNFLKLCGFSVATAAIAASCENPVKKAIPYLNKPEEIVPGTAIHYASTYFDGSEYNSIIVKVRDGRPIKIEGNPASPISRGRTSARVQASVLNLYDGSARLKKVLKDKTESSWTAVDSDITARLNDIRNAGQETVLITDNIISPSTKALISDFFNFYPGRHIMYSPVSSSGMLIANTQSFGIRAIPDYLFDKAEIIIAFSADFLGTWLSPVEFANRYGIAKDLLDGKETMVKHYQFESALTITGSKADKRFPIKPSEEPSLVLQLYNELSSKAGQASTVSKVNNENISSIANELWNNRGKSIIVSNSNDPNIQLVINGINYLLGNYGSTIDFSRPILTEQALDQDMEDLLVQLRNNTVGGIIFWNVNPVYDFYNSAKLIEGMKSLKLSVAISDTLNETINHVRYLLPSHNYLESWDDAEPKVGMFSLAQPAIRNIFNTRQGQDNILRWLNREENYYQYLRNYWETNIINQSLLGWDEVLQRGVFEKEPLATQATFNSGGIAGALDSISKVQKTNELEVILYPSVALGKGNHANNPWLMELPDPIAKISWENFAAISPVTAERLGLADGNLIRINKIKLPVHVQPGQAEDTISIALGYGREDSGKVASGIGQNVFPLSTFGNGTRALQISGFEFKKVEGQYALAYYQRHDTLEGRPIVRDTVLSKYKENKNSGNELHKEFEEKHVTLYQENEFPAHHWGMGIDLNKCVGCNTCVIACQAENNTPVVGKEEVMKTRYMHWMRVDRYYAGDTSNPEVAFQPLPCQHCDNAPCENVCPVSATTHSNEGLNQMAYSRCVGTKYCINNCPYKVRRFNWFRYATNEKFDYNMNSDLGRMVLNPDVTVRERGVVEKCTFCVQRIQLKKLEAKLENRTLVDGEVQPACVQACPANALIFGDLNNPKSRVSKWFKDPRNYHLLEELHTLPSAGYLTLVRNKEEEI